jgi:hypothetical protein
MMAKRKKSESKEKNKRTKKSEELFTRLSGLQFWERQ